MSSIAQLAEAVCQSRTWVRIGDYAGCELTAYSEKQSMRAKDYLLVTCLLSSITTMCYGQVETYLPMHIGDSWTYVNDDGATRVFSVIAEQEIDGRTYYEYDDFFSPCGFPGWRDGEETRYLFRRDPVADVLYQYDPAIDSDVARYDFTGENWGEFGNQLVDRGIVYSAPAGDFGDSVRFAYAMSVDCGVFHETLAPGVGPVGFFSSWEGEYRLQSYSVVPEPEISLRLLCMISVAVVALRHRPAIRQNVRGQPDLRGLEPKPLHRG